MQEKWIGLKYKNEDYSNLFEVSDLGNIRRIGCENNLKQYTRKDGYKTIAISLGGRKNCITLRMHKAVLESFNGINKEKPNVNHIDFDRGNNKLYNLEWVTSKENYFHSIEKINNNRQKGIERFDSKLTEENILFIRKNYIPKDKIFGCRALAIKFNMAHSAMSYAINKKSYFNI